MWLAVGVLCYGGGGGAALAGADRGHAPEIRAGDGDYVVVVHGWAWLRDAMRPTVRFLHRQGYHVISVHYDSREEMPEAVVSDRIAPAVAAHCTDPERKIHFVGHSMGCLMIRAYLRDDAPSALGRVVLLAPPNQGIELVDRMKDWGLFCRIFGEPARLLGTAEDGFARRLGPVAYPAGVIMGCEVGLPVLSSMLPGPDDGVVTVESGRLEGMKDFLTVRCMHMTLPGHPVVLRQTVGFLRRGVFDPRDTSRRVARILFRTKRAGR